MTELERNKETHYKCSIFYVLPRLDLTLPRTVGSHLLWDTYCLVFYGMPTVTTTVSCANQTPSERMESISLVKDIFQQEYSRSRNVTRRSHREHLKQAISAREDWGRAPSSLWLLRKLCHRKRERLRLQSFKILHKPDPWWIQGNISRKYKIEPWADCE